MIGRFLVRRSCFNGVVWVGDLDTTIRCEPLVHGRIPGLLRHGLPPFVYG
jgi:hypothetical protein